MASMSAQVDQENRRLKQEAVHFNQQLSNLQLKLDVEKEANGENQKLIDKLNSEVAILRSQRK